MTKELDLTQGEYTETTTIDYDRRRGIVDIPVQQFTREELLIMLADCVVLEATYKHITRTTEYYIEHPDLEILPEGMYPPEYSIELIEDETWGTERRFVKLSTRHVLRIHPAFHDNKAVLAHYLIPEDNIPEWEAFEQEYSTENNLVPKFAKQVALENLFFIDPIVVDQSKK